MSEINKIRYDGVDYDISGNTIVSPTEPTTGEKVWFKKGKNKFNKNKVTNGYYVSASDGTLVSSTSENNVSEFINISGNTTLISNTSGSVSHAGAFYDCNYTFISGFNAVTAQSGITVPTNAKYVRFTVLNENLNTFMVQAGTTLSEYEPYIEPAIYVKNDDGLYEEFIRNS